MTAKTKTVDFSNVKEGGQFNQRRKPEGEYIAEITGVQDHNSKEGNYNFLFTIQIAGDRRASYPHYCGVDEKQLWKVRNLIAAAGMKVPSGRTKLDPNKLIGKKIGVLLEDDEYEGRIKSIVAEVFPVSEGGDFLNAGESSSKKAKHRVVEEDDDDDDEDEDEAPPAKKSSKKSRRPEPEDDDEDEDEDEPEPPKKSAKKAAKKKAVVEEDDEDEEDDDEDDDEPPAPKKKATKKARKRDDEDEDDEEPKPRKKASKRRSRDEDDDDLEIDDL